MKSFLDNEFSSFRSIQGKLLYIDEVLIANLSPAKAPVTRMRFQNVPFSYPCVFKYIQFGLRFHNRLHRFRVNRRRKRNDIVTGPKAPVTGIRFHGFTSCLHGNDENDHEKAAYLNTQSKWIDLKTQRNENGTI